jgi:predicted deacylase
MHGRRHFLAGSVVAAAALFPEIPLAEPASAAAGGTAAGGTTAGGTTPAGSRSFRWLPVATLSDGTALQLPLHEIRGDRPGPTLGITAAVHGWEILGIEVLRRLLRQVGTDFAGRILAVPVANPPAFRSQSRHSPIDSQDLNNVFPGSERGWVSARIAQQISRAVIEPADFFVDIHGGDHSCTVNYAMGNTRQVALESGFPVVRTLDDVFGGASNLSGTAMGQAMSLGKRALGFEVGAGYQADELCIATALRGLLNAMRMQRMLPDMPQRPARQWLVRHTRVLRVNHGGLFLPALSIDRLNQPIAGGTTLGHVVNPHTLETVETLTAPWERGVLMMHKAGIAMVEAGLWVFNVGNLDTAEEVRNG